MDLDLEFLYCRALMTLQVGDVRKHPKGFIYQVQDLLPDGNMVIKTLKGDRHGHGGFNQYDARNHELLQKDTIVANPGLILPKKYLNRMWKIKDVYWDEYNKKIAYSVEDIAGISIHVMDVNGINNYFGKNQTDIMTDLQNQIEKSTNKTDDIMDPEKLWKAHKSFMGG